MNQQKRGIHTKPKLLIQIQDFKKKVEQFKQQERFNVVDMKPLRSAKNVHQMKKFNFGDQTTQVCHSGRKQKKLKRLEQDKVNLINSLEVLKQSAVSAIAQKQDEIITLKMRSCFVQYQHIEAYEQRLRQEQQIRKSLEDQVNELLQKLNKERRLHVEELQEKENIIEQLCREISESRCQIENLQQNDIIKDKKIRLLQQQNLNLSEQLQVSSIATALKQRSEHIVDLDETIKRKPVLSVASSIQSRKYYTYTQPSEHLYESQIDKSYINEKLQEINRAHKEQMLDLRIFFEKRIATLRQIYLKQASLPTESSEAQSIIRNRTFQNNQSQKHSSNKKNFDGIHINLKDMYSIDEIVENQLETSRSNLKNLKNQIRMQNLSQCPSVQPRFLINQDTESQFTTKYFEIPNRFLKKNQSSESITINNDTDLKITIKKNFKQPQNSKNCSRKPSQVEIGLKPQKPNRNKFYIFGAGFLSGMALTSIIINKFSKRFFD